MEVTFPSWGGEATITAHRRDGSDVVLGDGRIDLDDVRSFTIRSARSGYDIEPLARMKGMTAELLHPRPQDSAPLCGPTLAIRLLDRRRPRRASFGVRLLVHRPAERRRRARSQPD